MAQESEPDVITIARGWRRWLRLDSDGGGYRPSAARGCRPSGRGGTDEMPGVRDGQYGGTSGLRPVRGSPLVPSSVLSSKPDKRRKKDAPRQLSDAR
jgi:hypothetical protein